MRGLRAKGLGAATALAALLAVGAWHGRAAASTYQVFYDTSESKADVFGVLSADAAGNLYGVNVLYSSVFVLTPPKAGGTAWTSHTLVTFPYGSPTTGWDTSGSVALAGNKLVGLNASGGADGQGTVFEYSSAPTPTTVVLHAFAGNDVTPPDGATPWGGLTAGLGGMLYGVTFQGGDDNYGTLYAVSPSTTAPRYSILHRFGAKGDGISPTDANLAVDAQGNLYGATGGGGLHGSGSFTGDGTVYEMHYVNGGWKEQVLYAFNGSSNGATDLWLPTANVALDTIGNLYGCAGFGGAYNDGGIFMLTPPATPGGAWAETILTSFGNVPGGPLTTGNNGCAVTFDTATGQLLGTTASGGTSNKGTIFELTPPAQGQSGWALSVIHSFTGVKPDGANPVAQPLEVNGAFYGGTQTGSFYEFTP